MRAVLHGDVVAAARVLLALPDSARASCLDRMLDEARWADAYRKRTGRAHPLWGNGSLMAAALRRPARPEPALGDAEYCRCLIAVFEALLARRGAPQPRAQDTQVGTAGSISSRPGGMGSPHSVQ
jgi:hypothetical protein